MGQKVNPHGLRVGVIKDWDSKWFAGKKEFGDQLVEDYNIRNYIKFGKVPGKSKLNQKMSEAARLRYEAGIAKIEIERKTDRIYVTIHVAKPGVIIGKGGADIDKLKKALEKMTGKTVNVNIAEIKQPDINAQLVAENIAAQLERRVSFRRAMKQVMGRSMRLGVKGIKTAVSGRVGGAEIARTEQYHEGTIPLQTLRADIDYGFAEASTTYGIIGVKVWIYKGEVLHDNKKVSNKAEGGR